MQSAENTTRLRTVNSFVTQRPHHTPSNLSLSLSLTHRQRHTHTLACTQLNKITLEREAQQLEAVADERGSLAFPRFTGKRTSSLDAYPGAGLRLLAMWGLFASASCGIPPSRIRAVWSNTKLALQGVGFSQVFGLWGFRVLRIVANSNDLPGRKALTSLQPRSKAVRSSRVGFTSPSSFPYLSSILGNERLTFGSMLGLSRNLGIAS